MVGTITTLVPLYLVFQHFPIDLNRLSSAQDEDPVRMEPVYITHFFLFQTCGCEE